MVGMGRGGWGWEGCLDAARLNHGGTNGKHGKKYMAAAAKVDIDKVYPLSEAFKLVKETSITN